VLATFDLHVVGSELKLAERLHEELASGEPEGRP
jgi:hypothetical protein